MRQADPAGPELADAVSRLRRAMRRSARAHQGLASEGTRSGALSVAQLEMLSCVAENPASRPGQLGRLLLLAPSSVTSLVNALRAAGLITRVSGPDRRTAELRLTDAGEAAVHRWYATNEAIVSAALASLPPASRAALSRALPAFRELTGAIDALADREPPLPLAAGSSGGKLPGRSDRTLPGRSDGKLPGRETGQSDEQKCSSP
jgi:DNA-binding MarR family transcriptional regulator